MYLRLKGSNKPKTFHSAVKRALGHVVKVIGNKPLHAISRKDAAAVRDDLVAKGLAASSVTRVLTTIKAVINFATQEEGLALSNPFKGLFVNKSIEPKKRMPVPLNDLQRVQRQCRHADDELRWIVAAISDTSCRIAEIVELSKADVRLDGDIPFILIRPGRGEGLKRPRVSGIYRWLDQRFGKLLGPTNRRIQRYYFHAITKSFLLTPIVPALLYQIGLSSKRTPNARCTASEIHSEIF